METVLALLGDWSGLSEKAQALSDSSLICAGFKWHGRGGLQV